MGNIETTMKFSRLKSISSIDFLVFLVLFYFIVIYLFSVSLYNYKGKLSSFIEKKMFIQMRLYNLMTYVFKGHVKIVKIYMVKFNVSILNRLKITGFL